MVVRVYLPRLFLHCGMHRLCLRYRSKSTSILKGELGSHLNPITLLGKVLGSIWIHFVTFIKLHGVDDIIFVVVFSWWWVNRYPT